MIIIIKLCGFGIGINNLEEKGYLEIGLRVKEFLNVKGSILY